MLLAHEWGDELQKKEAGIYSVAVGLCQFPLLQSLPGFGLDGSAGNGAPSTVRVCLGAFGECSLFWKILMYFPMGWREKMQKN